jgi:hypothetical protein
MDSRQLKDILATHADQLLQGRRQRPRTKDYRGLSPADQNELNSLLNMAERVKYTLKPVHPPRLFESNLKKELLTTANQHRTTGYVAPDPSRDLLILTGIFLGFIFALAGLLLALRLRNQPRRSLNFNLATEEIAPNLS